MDVCGFGSIEAHHCFTTAVHAIHMHTDQILMFHGLKDQRIWKIGIPPDDITWHPNLLNISGNAMNPASADMFCSGHAQLNDGRIFFASGNVNNNPSFPSLISLCIP